MICLFLLLLPLLHLCSARPASSSPSYPLASIRQLAQFPNNTWIENLAVRSNGHILLTLFTSPSLYTLDPLSPNSTPELLTTIPSVLGTLGIAEISPDVFAISAGNVSFATQTLTPKSFSVWTVDLRDCTSSSSNSSQPTVSKITDIPEAVFLNGVTTATGGLGGEYILLADSLAGVIWRVNLQTRAYDIVLNDTTTQPIGTLFEGGFGANGVHVRNSYLYYTNTNKGFFRVPIDVNGAVKGTPENISTVVPVDDFTFDKHGNAIVAAGAQDQIEIIGLEGKKGSVGEVMPLAFKSGELERDLEFIEGNTAVQFGRTAKDKGVGYVTTNGGLSGNSTAISGGRVLALNFKRGY